MRPISANASLSRRTWVLGLAGMCLSGILFIHAQQPVAKRNPPTTAGAVADPKAFDTPQHAADALIEAADKFDVVALAQIFGPAAEDVIFSGEFAQDRKHAAD